MKPIPILFLLLALARCNIWDNLYSQTLADSPIVITQSLNLAIDMDKLRLKVDFNAELQIVTVFVYLKTLANMLSIELLRAQLDMSNLVVSMMRVDGGQCERYNLASLQNNSIAQPKLSKERMFLINLVFKFVGKSEKGFFEKQILDIYKFQPFLFSPPNSDRLKEFKKELQVQGKAGLDELQFYEQMENNIQLFLHINAKTGSIEAIYSGQNQDKNVPFRTASEVGSKMLCEQAIQSIGVKDISRLVEFIQKRQKENQ